MKITWGHIKTLFAPQAQGSAKKLYDPEFGGARIGQLIGVISVIENGYILALGKGDGMIATIQFAPDEKAVGEALLNYVAKENLK